MKVIYRIVFWSLLTLVSGVAPPIFDLPSIGFPCLVRDTHADPGRPFLSNGAFNRVPEKFLPGTVPTPPETENTSRIFPALQVSARMSPETSTHKTAAKKSAGAPADLSLRELIRLVQEYNEQIRSQVAEWAIRKEAVKSAKAIFEPAFVGNYQKGETNRQNTVQEIVSQGFLPEFHEQSDDFQAAVEGLVPTGARVRLEYSLRDFTNSIEKNYGVDGESQSFLGASLSQPLLKGAGVTPTMAGIRVAKADEEIAFQSYREQMMRVVSEAISAYWDLYKARQRYNIREDSVKIAEQILEDNVARVRTGKMAETEVFEARSGLSRRKSLRRAAEQEIVLTTNTLRTYFSDSVADSPAGIQPVEKPASEDVETTFEKSLKKALALRSEYLSSKRKIERENIRLVYAENQIWPQVDLNASYGLNGLAVNPKDSFDEALSKDYPTWAIGLEMRIPLGGDIKSRSELIASRERKKQALLELKAVEVILANAVDTALRGVENTREQIDHYSDVVDYSGRLLNAEISRFRAGKSNSRLLLEKEEDLLLAKEAHLDSLVNYTKAVLGLDLAQGSLLLRYGIEVMEVNP